MELKDIFPNLSLFSDMDWDAVTKEYEQTSQYITFPEYLELKSEQGDCPQYLFELAYFDAALTGLQEGEFFFPDSPGIHLNPSLRFLDLDYDVLKMVSDAQDGIIEVHERENVLGIYVDAEGDIRFHEITRGELWTLQAIESGQDPEDITAFKSLTDAGILVHITQK